MLPCSRHAEDRGSHCPSTARSAWRSDHASKHQVVLLRCLRLLACPRPRSLSVQGCAARRGRRSQTCLKQQQAHTAHAQRTSTVMWQRGAAQRCARAAWQAFQRAGASSRPQQQQQASSAGAARRGGHQHHHHARSGGTSPPAAAAQSQRSAPQAHAHKQHSHHAAPSSSGMGFAANAFKGARGGATAMPTRATQVQVRPPRHRAIHHECLTTRTTCSRHDAIHSRAEWLQNAWAALRSSGPTFPAPQPAPSSMASQPMGVQVRLISVQPEPHRKACHGARRRDLCRPASISQSRPDHPELAQARSSSSVPGAADGEEEAVSAALSTVGGSMGGPADRRR